eukprot:gene4771-biopygen11731
MNRSGIPFLLAPTHRFQHDCPLIPALPGRQHFRVRVAYLPAVCEREILHLHLEDVRERQVPDQEDVPVSVLDQLHCLDQFSQSNGLNQGIQLHQLNRSQRTIRLVQARHTHTHTGVSSRTTDSQAAALVVRTCYLTSAMERSGLDLAIELHQSVTLDYLNQLIQMNQALDKEYGGICQALVLADADLRGERADQADQVLVEAHDALRLPGAPAGVHQHHAVLPPGGEQCTSAPRSGGAAAASPRTAARCGGNAAPLTTTPAAIGPFVD